MHLAFHRGGRAAINKVMKQQPAVFLKLLMLLVPREMKVENSGGLKAMSGEQLEAAIEAIQGMLDAKVAGVRRRETPRRAMKKSAVNGSSKPQPAVVALQYLSTCLPPFAGYCLRWHQLCRSACHFRVPHTPTVSAVALGITVVPVASAFLCLRSVP